MLNRYVRSMETVGNYFVPARQASPVSFGTSETRKTSIWKMALGCDAHSFQHHSVGISQAPGSNILHVFSGAAVKA